MIANLMASPRAKGLFQRAIGESSSWTTAQIGRLATLSDAEQAGVKIADGLGAKSLAELRAKPAASGTARRRTRRGSGDRRAGFCLRIRGRSSHKGSRTRLRCWWVRTATNPLAHSRGARTSSCNRHGSAMAILPIRS